MDLHNRKWNYKKQEIELFLPNKGLWSKNFFYKMFPIFLKEPYLDYLNRKLNFLKQAMELFFGARAPLELTFVKKRKKFWKSTILHITCTIFALIYFCRYCSLIFKDSIRYYRILWDVVGHCKILSNIVILWPIVFNLVRYCQLLLDIIICCLILSDIITTYPQILSNIVRYR